MNQRKLTDNSVHIPFPAPISHHPDSLPPTKHTTLTLRKLLTLSPPTAWEVVHHTNPLPTQFTYRTNRAHSRFGPLHVVQTEALRVYLLLRLLSDNNRSRGNQVRVIKVNFTPQLEVGNAPSAEATSSGIRMWG
jgi:hypothetical protein